MDRTDRDDATRRTPIPNATRDRASPAEKESKGKEGTKAVKKNIPTGSEEVVGPAKKDNKNQRGPMKSGFTRKRDFDRSAKG